MKRKGRKESGKGAYLRRNDNYIHPRPRAAAPARLVSNLDVWWWLGLRLLRRAAASDSSRAARPPTTAPTTPTPRPRRNEKKKTLTTLRVPLMGLRPRDELRSRRRGGADRGRRYGAGTWSDRRCGPCSAPDT